MPGTLYVVATPIGNLEDVTLRALRVLRDVNLIAAEDTRRTSRLLTHHGISTPTISYHAHNSRTRGPQLIERLAGGAAVALVTDAGTPGVSDPGVELVAACIRADIPVDPIPGVNAPITAAVGSGFPMERLTILGFPPPRAKARTAWLLELNELRGTVTFFEAPHRVVQTVRELVHLLGERPIVVARELTKMHQQFIRGTAAEVLVQLREPRGEFTVVIGPKIERTEFQGLPSDQELAEEFGEIAKTVGSGRREAIAAVARKYSCAARDVYAAIERAKESVK